MLNAIKQFFKKTGKTKNICDHPGVSFSLEELDKPSHMQCHFCDKILVKYDTEIPLIEGCLHTTIKKFWIDPHPELATALTTSPREYGNLKVEKFLRKQGYI